MRGLAKPIRPLLWIGSSRQDYAEFPPQVQEDCGFALFLAQTGQHPPSAKPMKGLGGGTVELVESFDGDSYRTVYTVRFRRAVYVLHAFKKKSKQGIKTPQLEVDLIRRRLRDAESDYAARFGREDSR
jgi:phage-related protein